MLVITFFPISSRNKGMENKKSVRAVLIARSTHRGSGTAHHCRTDNTETSRR